MTLLGPLTHYLPYDVWALVIAELGAADVARLSMVCDLGEKPSSFLAYLFISQQVSKHFAELFDQSSIWSRVARREAFHARLAPHSLDVKLLSADDPKQLVVRSFQVEAMIQTACQTVDAHSTARSSISLSEPGLFSDFTLSYSADGTDSPFVKSVKLKMLPGARWLLGSAQLEADQYSLLCWDLASVGDPSDILGSHERMSATTSPQLIPVATFRFEHLSNLLMPPKYILDAHFAAQFDASIDAVDVFLTYTYSSIGSIRSVARSESWSASF